MVSTNIFNFERATMVQLIKDTILWSINNVTEHLGTTSVFKAARYTRVSHNRKAGSPRIVVSILGSIIHGKLITLALFFLVNHAEIQGAALVHLRHLSFLRLVGHPPAFLDDAHGLL